LSVLVRAGGAARENAGTGSRDAVQVLAVDMRVRQVEGRRRVVNVRVMSLEAWNGKGFRLCR
jgi:hypothetical protein